MTLYRNRTYHPKACHLRFCKTCGEWCQPFPHETSEICPVCHWEKEQQFRKDVVEELCQPVPPPEHRRPIDDGNVC